MTPSPEARALWEEIHDVLRNEEAWEIIERHLKAAEERGVATALKEIAENRSDDLTHVYIDEVEV